ncbi:outer membrane receptor protein involved in Fe transport [Altererythrobacter atlanticus]|uniref:TonB-dependent receptor domain-containing protein n=1 Tax=Croceibacterium atlanticum TaxID=1267766 RepID=UPI00062C675E|nr:TonB-dependent receptor [Croceibacterium atlanticum]MBB5732419.1 outer membrane receptor protein involved in Fe transport [Croceibacterium atlanticum]
MAAPAAAQVSSQAAEADCAANPQDARCAGIGTSAVPSAPAEAIVVTGSRIARKDYEANSPIVTVDDAFLKQSATAAVEEQLNRLPQFVVAESSTTLNTVSGTSGPVAAGTSIQPSATSTPGAATVSLRGVGANRTLVLIDGRRGTPGNANGAVDVSTIPSAALQRVEIISGGASATYGADAIAGVTNFILKRDFQGVEIDAQAGVNQQGDGFEYQLSGIVGSDFDSGRGNVSLAMSVNTRELLMQSDNPFYRKLWADPDTTSGGLLGVARPGITGIGLTPNQINPATGLPLSTPGAGCEFQVAPRGCVLTDYFAGSTPGVPNNTTAVYLNQDGSLFSPSSFFGANYDARGSVGFFKLWDAVDAQSGVYWKTTSAGTLYGISTNTAQVVPSDRYNFLARGNYEINDWIGVFAQGLFSNSTTYTALEPSAASNLYIPWGDGKYTGAISGGYPQAVYQNPSVPSAVIGTQNVVNGQIVTTYAPNPAFIDIYSGILPCATRGDPGYNPTGCTNTEAFQAVVPGSIQALLNARPDPNARVSLAGMLPNPRESYQDVTTYTLIAGLEGYVPGTDWTWEAFVNHGIARTISRQTGMYSLNRLRAVISAPNFGQNFEYTGNQYTNGSGATTGSCTTGLNFFGGYQGISDDCRQAIAEDNKNIGTSRQTIVEANMQGGLFEIPWAGDDVRFAAGATYREARYEFLPSGQASAGREFLDSLVGSAASTIMENTGYNTREFYGELLIPLVADLPLIESFSLEVGGRMSDYSTSGTSYTYKILGDWQVTDWLRLRGGYNRAERAPNIGEQMLEMQRSISIDPIGDVCSTRHNNLFSANPNANSSTALDVQAVCLELMARDNGGVYAPITNPDGSPNPNSFYNPADALVRQAVGGGFSTAPRVGTEVYRRDINPSAPVLQPEKADTWTVGAVIRSPLASGPLSRLSLTVDYFNIKISDPISVIGAGAQLLRCVSPAYNPAAAGVAAGATSSADLNDPEIRARAQAALANAESTCSGVFRDPSTGLNFTGQFNTADTVGTYGNEGLVKLSGIDANLSWSTDAGPGSVFLNLNANYMIDFKIRAFDGQPLVDYVGTTGTGALGVSSGSSFEYKIFGVLGYNLGPASISLQWQHLPKTEDGNEALYLNGLAAEGSDQTGLPAYNLFHLNTSYQLSDVVRLRFGVDNLFNTRPPLTNIDANIDRSLGQIPGGSYSLFHDTLGRRFSFGANVSF